MYSIRQIKTGGRIFAAVFLIACNLGASAAPGSPGIPAPPSRIFYEDFENRVDTSRYELLSTYLGNTESGNNRYTADPYWLDTSECNGLVVSYNSDPANIPAGCQNFTGVRVLARVMGRLHGKLGVERDSESVLSAFTDRQDATSATAPNNIQFETTNPISSLAPNRFITFGLDAVVTGNTCGQAEPRYDFYLVNNGIEQPLNATPINVCDPLSPIPGTTSYGRSIKADTPILTKAQNTNVKLRLKNREIGFRGNDTAVDRFLLEDVTPQLDKNLATGPLTAGAFGVGKPARLTFTITNRTDLLLKQGWSFTDALPSNLVVASPSNLDNRCGNTSVAASPGSNQVVVTNGTLAAGASSCTIAVDVSSTIPGTYVNDESNISNLVGLDKPGRTQVVFVNEPLIRLRKVLSTTRLDNNDQFNLSIAGRSAGDGTASRATAGTGQEVLPATPLPLTALIGREYVLSETSIDSARENLYLGQYACSNSNPANSTTVLPSGAGKTFTITPLSATDNILCTFTNSPAGADLAVLKTSSSAAVQSGDVVTYTIRASNSGPAAADGAVLTDVPGAGLACRTEPALIARAECVASGNATCPALPPTQLIDALFGPGLVIPTFPSDGKIVVTLQCRVSATGN
ncbi:MAG: DUF11 domain-containing protein [Comamonadaceae bacterium]|nr:MAG: DUF11 domain-containing protein [Comamonadaceae bacterium]